MGMMAPARSAAPTRVGRHRAATTTTATSAIMTTRSPAITAPGLENAFPAVSECVAPADVRRVKLSHEGANGDRGTQRGEGQRQEKAHRMSLRAARCARRLRPQSDRPARRAGKPSDQAEYQAGAHEMCAVGDRRAGVGEEEPERDDARSETEECADP